MRELYQEIQEFYLLGEGLSKEPSSEIEFSKSGNRQTKLTTYRHDSSIEVPSKYHKDYSGVNHTVAWKNIPDASAMSMKEKKTALHDAAHLHNHFIKHGTEVGDVVINEPLSDQDDTGKNKRSRIYKRFGFGELSNKTQYGIVKQHPHDHPDESKRGQKYLHPLEHHEITAHGDIPSAGASNNTPRHLIKQYEDGKSIITKYNDVIHDSFVPTFGIPDHQLSTATHSPHYKDSIKHHKEHVNNVLG